MRVVSSGRFSSRRGWLLGLLAATAGCRASPGGADASDTTPRSLLQVLEPLAEEVTEPRLRTELWAELGVAHVEAGHAASQGKVHVFFERARTTALAIPIQDDRDRATELVVVAMAKAQAFEDGLALASEIKAPERRARALVELSTSLASAGELDRALAVLSPLPEGGDRSAAYAAVGVTAAKRGDLARAVELSVRCSIAEDAAQVVAAVALGHAKKREMRVAEDAAGKLSSARFRSEVYEGLALESYARGDERRAIVRLDLIESSWIQSRAAFLLARLANGKGKRAEATKLGDRARAIAEGINDPTMRGAALEDLARLTIEDGAIANGLALAGKASSRDVMKRATGVAVARLLEDGKLEEAEKMVAPIAHEPIWGAEPLGALGLAYARHGRIPEALGVLVRVANLELRLPFVARVVVLAGESAASPDGVANLTRALR